MVVEGGPAVEDQQREAVAPALDDVQARVGYLDVTADGRTLAARR
jgi:hypothetical protein